MGGFTDYFEERVLNHVFGKADLTPGVIYVGLSAAEPCDDGSGLDEPDGNGYVRVQTTPSDWSAAADGSITNLSEINFSMATGSWGTITHFALFDAATGGKILSYGQLSNPVSVDTGGLARFAIGELSISLD